MIELAIKETEIVIDLKDEAHPGLGVLMETLTDVEAAQMMSGRLRTVVTKDGTEIESEDENEPKDEEVIIDMPFEEMLGLFAKKFRSFVGEEVVLDGEAFDPKREDHMRSLPLPWKLTAMGELMSYATSLSKDVVKNSLAQARHLLGDSTPSED